MLATLRVGEVGTIVLMYCEAEPAFEGADMVLEEVGVFVEIDGFEGEFAESFSAVGVGGAVGCYSSSAKFGPGSILVIHGESITACRFERIERKIRKLFTRELSLQYSPHLSSTLARFPRNIKGRHSIWI